VFDFDSQNALPVEIIYDDEIIVEGEWVCVCIYVCIDWLAFGSNPYGPDAPRPYRQALCAP